MREDPVWYWPSFQRTLGFTLHPWWLYDFYFKTGVSYTQIHFSVIFFKQNRPEYLPYLYRLLPNRSGTVPVTLWSNIILKRSLVLSATYAAYLKHKAMHKMKKKVPTLTYTVRYFTHNSIYIAKWRKISNQALVVKIGRYTVTSVSQIKKSLYGRWSLK